MDDLISRQDAIDALEEERCPCESDYDEGYLSMLDKAIWIMQEWLPSVQPDRSLWFRIGEICVDESKGFISAGRAVEKIRELLREAERREE